VCSCRELQRARGAQNASTEQPSERRVSTAIGGDRRRPAVIDRDPRTSAPTMPRRSPRQPDKRRERLLRRQFAQAKAAHPNFDYSDCPICLEELHQNAAPLVLTCGHAYHRHCWMKHLHAHAPPLALARNPANAPLIVAAGYLNAFGGAPCPLCRREHPTLHLLAARFAGLRDSCIARKQILLNAERCLQIAEGKLRL
jgi:hypothetical protein